MSSLPEYLLFVQRYESTRTDPAKFFYHPIRHKTGVYGLGLAGFRMTATFGKHHFVTGHSRRDLFNLAVNGKNVLRGSYVELETAPEFNKLARQTKAHARTGNAHSLKAKGR